MKPLPVYDSADYCPGCGRDEGADGQDAAHGILPTASVIRPCPLLATLPTLPQSPRSNSAECGRIAGQ